MKWADSNYNTIIYYSTKDNFVKTKIDTKNHWINEAEKLKYLYLKNNKL